MYSITAVRRSRPLQNIFAAITCTLALATPALAKWHYVLSDYPGAADTLFLGLNDRGIAVGFSSGFTNVADIPFYYRPRTQAYTPIPTISGFEATEVWNINDSDTVVGIAHSLDYSVETAFTRDANGNVHLLSHPGFPYSEGQGINDEGMVVGEAWNADYSEATGFLYNPADHSYIDFMPSVDTEVHGINSHGEVAGMVTLSAGTAYANSPAGNYGFIRTIGGSITLFRVNGMDTYARAINEEGVVAGEVFDASGNASGFVIAPDGLATHCRRAPTHYRSVTVPLLLVPGQAQTYVQAVTGEGSLAGVTIDADGGTHGFVAN
jgi:hypothetical protein